MNKRIKSAQHNLASSGAISNILQIPGGDIMDSEVLRGVMLNKDVTHAKMARRIENPRVVLLDCTLEYKKAESQTNFEVTKEADWTRLLEQEEEAVKQMCDDIIAVKPDLVITEKGVSGVCFWFGACSYNGRIFLKGIGLRWTESILF